MGRRPRRRRRRAAGRGATGLQRLEVAASCEHDRTGDQDAHEYRVTALLLDVRGRVDGLDAAGFEEMARHADEQCPISAAVRGNVDVRPSATLEEPS